MCKMEDREIPYRVTALPSGLFDILRLWLSVLLAWILLLFSAQACCLLFPWSVTRPLPVPLFSHYTLSFLLFVTCVTCSRQAHTGWVGQQVNRAWEEEEQLTSVHFITWSQISSLNHLDILFQSFICHFRMLPSKSQCPLPAKDSQRY